MRKEIEALLDVAVKRSLGYNPVQAEKWSIVPCAHNEFLADGYDSIKDLEHTLMLKALMQAYNVKNGRV